MLDKVKTALRLTTTAFDENEITPLINACKLDLKLAGVNVIEVTDPLIVRAVTLYVKGNFGFLSDSDKFLKSYEMLKNSLALAGDYNTVKEA